MATTRRRFVHTASVAMAGLGVAGLPAPAKGTSSAGAKPEKLRILILGGTGFFGPAIVEEATRRGHTMTLFNRGKTNPHLFPQLEKVKGDREVGIEPIAELVEAGRRWDVIVDTTAYVPSHVEASAQLVAGFATQYVLLSTIGVYADHSLPVDETSPLAEVSDEWAAGITTIRGSLENYGAMKGRCEAAAEHAMPGRVTNIRPGLIVGPLDRSDRLTYWVVRVARGGEVLAPGDGTDPVQYVDARDLAIWTLDCIEQKVTGIFNAATPAGRFTMAEILYGLKASCTTDARFTWVETDFLEQYEVAAWTQLPVWVPAKGENAAFHLASTERAVAAGLEFRPLAETARDTLEWFEDARPADYEFGRRAGLPRQREAEVLAAWNSRSS